jgi:hypothetical protein
VKSSERREVRRSAEATLTTVDAALATERVAEGDERERELGRLALALREGAPEPSASFAVELDRHLEAGFAREPAAGGTTARRGRERRSQPSRPGLFDRPALAALAVALLALVLGGGTLASLGGLAGDGGSSSTSGGGALAPLTAPREESDSGDTAAPTTGVESDDGAGFAPERSRRRVERAAALTLAAPEERMEAVSEGVVAATARHRGYLVSSSTSSGEDEVAGGDFELRVPVDELRATLAELAALGTVRAQSQSGEDVTEAVVTAADRLEGARAERRGLLRRLERAGGNRQARALRRQLELVAGEIRGLRAEVEALEERTDYARVSVSLVDENSSGASGAPSSTESALEDALGSLLGAFNFTVRALGVLLPLAAFAGLVWLAFVALRRRRRESALR